MRLFLPTHWTWRRKFTNFTSRRRKRLRQQRASSSHRTAPIPTHSLLRLMEYLVPTRRRHEVSIQLEPPCNTFHRTRRAAIAAKRRRRSARRRIRQLTLAAVGPTPLAIYPRRRPWRSSSQRGACADLHRRNYAIRSMWVRRLVLLLLWWRQCARCPTAYLAKVIPL